MNKLYFICFLFISINTINAQTFHANQLYGRWNIVGYESLVIITPGMENEAEHAERLKEESLKSKGSFLINSNVIATHNSLLDFPDCKFSLIKDSLITIKILKNDYSEGYSSSFDIYLEDGKASDDFVRFLDKKYAKKTLNVFTTNYKVDYGDETLIICIINKNKIALYRDYDVIILERSNKQ